MHALPRLATATGSFDLPLAGSTAAHIAAALAGVEQDDRGASADLIAEALGQDAVFALWAACRAAAHCENPPRTVAQIAAWLRGSIRQELKWSEPDRARSAPSADRLDDELAGWADLVARSYSVARLASLLAERKALDAQRAYFVGLLHAAPELLHRASRAARPPAKRRKSPARSKPSKRHKPKPADYQDVLPCSLVSELIAVDASNGTGLSSVADCVAVALRIADGGRVPRSVSPGLRFDRRRHTADVSDARKRWLAASPLTHVLPALAARLDRLHTLECDFSRSLETEKLDALKELAYGAGHEINNPLANISARAQTLLPNETDPERRRMLTSINTQAFRAHEMIADMMLFARPPQPQPTEVNLVELLGTIVDELAPQAAAQHTQLVYDAPSTQLCAQVDKTQIAVALRALCSNALEALAGGGWVELAIEVTGADSSEAAKSRPSPETVQITVADSGPGIPPEVRPQIFDPFYSGREAGRGLGFGLSKCWRIVRMHGGRIDVDSAPAGGAKFTIQMPRDGAASVPGDALAVRP